MAVARTDLKVQELIGKFSITPQSPWIILDRQHTVVATGLTPELEVRFQMAVIKGGSPGEICGCLIKPPTPSEIEATEWLLCPSCETDDPVYVRLTAGNQHVVLDRPQGAAVRAILVYADSGEEVDEEALIQDVHVFAYIGTETTELSAAERGCPPECPYTPTFKMPCEGWAFRPDDLKVDKRATVELADCNGNVFALLYPTPSLGASTEFVDCEGKVIGYAVDDPHGDCEVLCADEIKCGAKAIQVFEHNGKTRILYDDGTVKELV